MLLSGLCAAALGGLLAVYARNLRRGPNRFAGGLAVFAGALFAESVGSVFVWWNLSGEYDAEVAVPMMILRAVELIGVVVLLWVSID
jgi:hypothetical protein